MNLTKHMWALSLKTIKCFSKEMKTLMLYNPTWMTLKNTMLSEGRQAHMSTRCMNAFVGISCEDPPY